MVMYPDYENSILNVSATILNHYHAPTIYPSISVLKDELEKTSKHVILILLDGMGINIIKKYLKADDFLNLHLKKTITSVFPPTTVAATNAVLSGLPPFSSGYLGWVQYFKREKTNNIVFINEDFYDKSKTFDIVLRDQYLKYPTIYEQIEKNSPVVKTYELFPNFRANGFDSFDKQIERAIEITYLDELNFTYIYWAEPDLTQHDFGTDSKVTENKLLELNQSVEKLAKAANDETLIIIIADHGLTNVEGIDLFDDQEISRYLKRKPSMEPRATNFFIKPFRKKKFKTVFDAKYGNDFVLLSKLELYESGLLGYGNKHKLLDDFIGDYIAISTSNKMFNFKEHSRFLGHHAGLTKDEMEVPLIIFHQNKDD
ncbi:MAG: alkaline phosphatase family protein [Firmicutes bacterium]|nr:alkaline phosphatase family protein [Bacillota bacterium]